MSTQVIPLELQALDLPQAPHVVPIERRSLDLIQASEVKDPSGHRRYGSLYTLRRRVKDGSLPFDMRAGKYYVRPEDLEALVEPVGPSFESVQAWARRIAAEAPSMTDHQAATIASILRGSLS
jgi:hypothetical protein